MANGQMDMADASAAPTPEQMAIYDQMRQEISPKQFSDEMLAGAEQIDPQAVAQFREELGALDIPPEVLDILNDLVDEILANPANYAEIRQKYMDQGAPGDILPEEFDPNFFAAFNMAIDQMIAAPSGPQAFAKGGIAELTPISKAISGYGRNGDTMLAHITPAEARMLRRRGGSGTTNPSTGLPEFWNPFKALGNAISGIGKAVKSFVSSSVGKIVTTVALGFFLGPAAASFLGVSSAAGVAAVGGFLGSSGATLLGGGSLSDALKAGAIGGLTAGATAGVMGGSDALSSGSYKGPTTVGGQVDAFKGMLPGGAAPPPVDTAPIISPTGEVQGLASVPSPEPKVGWGKSGDVGTDIGGVGKMPPVQAPSTAPLDIPGAKVEQGMLGKAKDFYSENISPSGIQKAGEPAAQKAGAAAMDALKARIPTATPTMLDAAYQTAYKSALPGMLSTYGPLAGLGLGALALTGGFETKPVQGGDITKSLNTSAADRMRQKGTQRENYVQSLPGVVYDKYGEPIYGKSTPLPTYDVPDYSGGYSTPGAGSGMRLPPVYMPPTGAMGSTRVAQPYNTSDMYSNLMPRTYADGGAVEPFGYADGGTVTDLYRSVLNRDPSAAEIANWKSQFGDSIDEGEMARFREAAGPELAIQKTEGDALLVKQKADRARVAQQKAMRRAQGSGTMYANINAGLASNAPEINPMDPTDMTFGARNRQTQRDRLQSDYGSMIGNQRNALAQQRGILEQQPSGAGAFSGGFGHMGIDEYGRGYGQGFNTAPPTDGRLPMSSGPGYIPPQEEENAPIFGVAPPRPFIPAPMSSGDMPPGLPPQPIEGGGNDAGQPGGGWGAKDVSDKAGFWGANPGWAGWHEKALSLVPFDTQEKRDEQLAIDMSRTIGPSTTTAAEQATKNTLADEMRAAEHGTGALGPTMDVSNTKEGWGKSGDVSVDIGGITGLSSDGRDSFGGGFGGFGGEGNGSGGGYMATGGMVGHYALGGLMAQPYGNMPPPMNTGGIAALGTGGYPRRTGQINGPGTGKSDSIPAMLSDGEFVMTAKAVRAAGKGDRRAGAKRMYKLMHQLEKNSERG